MDSVNPSGENTTQNTPPAPAVSERPKSRRRRWLVALLIIVLLVVAGLAAAMVLQGDITDSNTEQKAQSSAELLAKAQQYAYKKQYSEAFTAYEYAADATTSNDEKARIYTEEMNTALQAKQYDVVIKAGDTLLAIQKSANTYALVASAYESQGDKAKALEYYKKALDYFNSQEVHNSNVGAKQYRAKIKELGGTQ